MPSRNSFSRLNLQGSVRSRNAQHSSLDRRCTLLPSPPRLEVAAGGPLPPLRLRPDHPPRPRRDSTRTATLPLPVLFPPLRRPHRDHLRQPSSALAGLGPLPLLPGPEPLQ